MGGIIHPYIIVAKNVKILQAKGSVNISKNSPKGLVKIGFYVVGIADKKYERGIWQNSGEIIFHGKAYFGSGVRISNGGVLEFGEDVTITANSAIICHKRICIGNGCLISWDNLFMDTDFHTIYHAHSDDQTSNSILNEARDIIIGDRCWLCCRCMILKGTRIASDTVVAAGSTLAGKTIDTNHVIIGNQGKIIKENIVWHG